MLGGVDIGLDGGEACRRRFVRREAKKAAGSAVHVRYGKWSRDDMPKAFFFRRYFALRPSDIPALVFKPGILSLTTLRCSLTLCCCNRALVASSGLVKRRLEMAGGGSNCVVVDPPFCLTKLELELE